ncbi:MAG: energy-coupling factor transporter ATPase [Deltaproteobacteria bacterium]|uniref:Energy-coupling factor transporter ATPase n=1 Tax=Candidatus Zymogenus saltonus TaxID=2844893 RepID=A0A9D8PPR4_9DELT|nr:energy-coupling factor transporter ATPase [Candidatus Zymogenus saltonus]
MLIEIKDLYQHFNRGTPIEKEVLSGVSLNIEAGEFIALIGETGSGKTTLALHLNGILTPTKGSVRVGNFVVGPDTKKTGALTEMVGLVFQYPEHQLFEETVQKELKFGLRHKKEKPDEEEIEKMVRRAADLVNLDYDALKDRSPFTLSSGEQRKVAIASILAVDPEILIFDEPTQGLDAESRTDTIGNIKELNRKGKTVIVISHVIEEIINAAGRIIILSGGKITADCPSSELFSDKRAEEQLGSFMPEVTELLVRLKERGWDVSTDTFKAEDALREILSVLKRTTSTIKKNSATDSGRL